jgi:LDH2 family malate/lactate/ureidoglycolate dehydrogenase
MLLPVGAHKGFGLALMVDVLSGLLSGGAWGGGVKSLYRDMTRPNDCGHFLIALSADRFRDRAEYDVEAAALTGAVRNARRAPGAERLYLPGEIEVEAAERARADGIALEPEVLARVEELARELEVGGAISRRGSSLTT